MLLCNGPCIYGQNLVPNPGFEEVYDCDEFLDCSFPDQSPCPPWLCLNSENYFNSCSTLPAYDVPYNFRGFQFAHGGEGYAGGYHRDSREFLKVALLEPLVAGQCYSASMYINIAQHQGCCAIANLGMLFTLGDPGWPGGMDAQVEGTGQYYADTANWELISGSFIAFGGEDFLTIGNFYTNAQTPYHPDCAPFAQYAYYYFDDILVEETTTEVIEVDLGGPYEACDFVFLETNQQNDYDYLWSDGSTSENLIVTTSGTYSVTIYDHESCSAGIASADVIVLGSLPVNLGPDTVLCVGDTYTITLDEDAGSYVWSNGSTQPELTISTPGIYSVTFDDGCDISIDHIVVTYLTAPDFSLGADTTLCPGASYLLQMDPDLGDFLWDNNSNASFYLIDEPGLYALTISNQCGEFTDQVEVTYDEPPVFDLGPDSTVLCVGSNIDLQFDPTIGDFMWQDGNTNPGYTITGTGLYSLTVSNSCGTLSDDMYVEQISVPVVVLGGSLELCPGESEILDPGYNYGEYVWHDGSSDQVYLASTSGIYSVTVTNACGIDDASVVVTVAPPVIPPDLGPDISLCPGESHTLSVAGQGANILWNDFSTDDTLLVTTSGTYHVQVSTFCETHSDTIVVTVQNNPPSINLPPDFALCQGQTAILDAGISNASFLWSDGSQLPQLSVNAPGVYSLTVSNACGTDVDTIEISDGGPAPMVFLGQDTAICPGSTVTIVASFANVDTWSWPDGTDTTFFTTSTAGQVVVMASNSCSTVYDTIQIGLLPAVPSLDLGQDTTICPGEIVMLSIQIQDVTILWPDGSSAPTYFVSDSATVIASISNACGLSVDSVTVDWLPDVPVLDLGPDQSLCPGETITLTPGIADVLYQWHDSSTSSTFQTTQPDTISLVITNICGSNSDTIIITESTVGPQLDLGPDLYACAGSSVTIAAGILGVSYQWQDGSTDEHFTTITSGIYHLTVGNLCGSDSDTIVVEISGLPPSVFLGPDTILCVGSSLTLTSSVDSATTLEWQDGSTGHEFEVVTSGVYHLTASNLCGMDSDTIFIEINGLAPVINLGQDTTLCEGDTLVLTADADPFTSSTWQDGSAWNMFEVITTGLYHLTQHNACGSDLDSIMVSFEGQVPIPDLGADTMLCEGTTLLLMSTTDPGIITEWQDGSTTLTYLVDSPGVYVIKQANACGIGTDSLLVGYSSLPVPFTLGPDTMLCPGESLLLTAPQTTDQLEWQDGETAASYLVTAEGTYSLTIQNECGMEADEVQVNYIEERIQFQLEDNISLCAGEMIVLDASQSFSASYLWSTGSSLPSVSITIPGTYSVTVIAECMEDAHTITIHQESDCLTGGRIFIPNVFSPNGDQINDQFIIGIGSGIEVVKLEGTIFDRWGGVVYASEQIPFTWNGQLNEKSVLPGVYVYKINIHYKHDGVEYTRRYVGDVTLLR